MREIFHEGGWPMYPIVVLGFASLWLAIRHAAGQRGLGGAVIGLGVATLAMGVLGTTLGLQHSCQFLEQLPAEQKWIVWQGLRESLHCVGLALVFVIVDAMVMAAGSVRRATAPASHA